MFFGGSCMTDVCAASVVPVGDTSYWWSRNIISDGELLIWFDGLYVGEMFAASAVFRSVLEGVT